MESLRKGPEQKLSRKEHKSIRRARVEAKKNKEREDRMTRRGVIKAVTPFGWVSEVKKTGIAGLSSSGKISLAKDAVAVALGASVVLGEKSQEKSSRELFKDKVLSFTWNDVNNPEKLRLFVESLAEGYLQYTQTPRLTKEDLVSEGKVTLFKKEDDFLSLVSKRDSKYAARNQRGFADYKNKEIFLNLEALRKNLDGVFAEESSAGLILINALWHEWGHLDIQPRKEGEFINNPNFQLVPFAGARPELIMEYHGGIMSSQSYSDYQRFEEVWLETVTVKLMREALGRKEVVTSGEYYTSGVDVLLPLLEDVSFKTVHNMHATSDFEGFARLVGEKLPGDNKPIFKGERFFIALHKKDHEMIKKAIGG